MRCLFVFCVALDTIAFGRVFLLLFSPTSYNVIIISVILQCKGEILRAIGKSINKTTQISENRIVLLKQRAMQVKLFHFGQNKIEFYLTVALAIHSYVMLRSIFDEVRSIDATSP